MKRSKNEKTLEQRLKEMPSSEDFPIEKHIDRRTGTFVSEEIKDIMFTETDLSKMPPTGTADTVDLMIRNGNNIRVIPMIRRALFHSESVKLKQPNPSLRFVANISGMKLYLNLDTFEFWLLIRYDIIRVIWVKLAEHDLETLACINLLNKHDFDSSKIQRVNRVLKREYAKIKALNDKIHLEKGGRTL